MRLAEHPDFAAFLTAAATESELPEAFVEKDYWITEILRTIAMTLGEDEYEEECRRLFFRPHPSFAEVLERFTEIRNLV